MKLKDLDYVEGKGCITFSRCCVNLGKAANLKEGHEEYYCARNFPTKCADFGCPKLNTMSDPSKMRLRKLCPLELKRLKEQAMVTIQHDRK